MAEPIPSAAIPLTILPVEVNMANSPNACTLYILLTMGIVITEISCARMFPEINTETDLKKSDPNAFCNEPRILLMILVSPMLLI